MNATFDGVRIHQEELDREIETLRLEKQLAVHAPPRPGPVARGLASVGRGMISVGTALTSRVEAPSTSRSARSGWQA